MLINLFFISMNCVKQLLVCQDATLNDCVDLVVLIYLLR
jgi:hypothetical protein